MGIWNLRKFHKEKGNNEFESGSTGLRKIMNNEKICVSDL
jgi:hypothetical protein